MARLESAKKAGYYPTPVEVTALIATHLKAPEGNYRWLDPCCGEGTALQYLAQVLGGETYGIELDAERASEAKHKLVRVRHGDYAACRLPKKEQAGISVLFLNPPYDHDDRAGKRLELTFLRDTQEWLMAEGVLIYIIPQGRITPHIAAHLATHFRNVQIFRFPGRTYDSFHQVVIFANKRSAPHRDDKVAITIAQAKNTVLAELMPESLEPYQIPLIPQTSFYFRSTEVDPKEALAEALEVGVWYSRSWVDLLTPTDTAQEVKPLMPLRRGHIAMALAAGVAGQNK